MKITKAELEAKNNEIKNIRERLEASSLRESELRAQLVKAKEETEKAARERDSKASSLEYATKQAAEAEAELEQLHALMDVFPGCLPRESGEKETYHRTKYTAMTRLASWLAGRGTLAVSVSADRKPAV